MSVAVKTYLLVNHGEQEIRRFSVESDVSSSFDYLVEKIRNVYPNLKRADFQLFWKDEDKELITFSSDDELIDGLTHVQGEFFRVYIKEKQTSQKNGDAKVHPNVSCDGCDGPVVGSRFKCIACPDYDLCSTCEAKGLHAQHHLIRIRIPGSAPSFPWFMNPPFCRPMGRGGFGGRRGQFQGFRRGRGAWNCPRGGMSFGCTTGNRAPEPMPDSSTTGEENSGNDPAAFFHQFGATLNSFLGPLGVDVHTYADSHKNQPGECGQHAQKSSCPKPSAGCESTGEDATSEEPMDEASCPRSGDHAYVVIDEKDDDAPKDSDTRLADALIQMKNMGFTDDEGWLSHLLKAKDYDINKVLDAIQPKKQ